jgi:hypothetical protein
MKEKQTVREKPLVQDGFDDDTITGYVYVC